METYFQKPIFIFGTIMPILYLIVFLYALTKSIVKRKQKSFGRFVIPAKVATLLIFSIGVLAVNFSLMVLFPARCDTIAFQDLFAAKCYLLFSAVVLCYLTESGIFKPPLDYFLIFVLLVLITGMADFFWFFTESRISSIIFKYLAVCLNILYYFLFMTSVIREHKEGHNSEKETKAFDVTLITSLSLILNYLYIGFAFKGRWFVIFSVFLIISTLFYLFFLMNMFLWKKFKLNVQKSGDIAISLPSLSERKDKDFESIQLRLIELFETEKPYLSPGLTIGEVALKLYTNKVYLSRLINVKMDKNFKELVNYYRVREAMSLYSKNISLSISDLCCLCGFRNSASFTNAFKVHSGYTPGEWCREIKNQMKNGEQGM